MRVKYYVCQFVRKMLTSLFYTPFIWALWRTLYTRSLCAWNIIPARLLFHSISPYVPNHPIALLIRIHNILKWHQSAFYLITHPSETTWFLSTTLVSLSSLNFEEACCWLFYCCDFEIVCCLLGDISKTKSIVNPGNVIATFPYYIFHAFS